jgi:orotidine-5'-phosphate decarboxylase
LLVTPGVRPLSAAHDDQKRVMTPARAVRAGADYIVVGRAILKAPDPLRAAQEIVDEMKRAETEEVAGNSMEEIGS